MGLVVICEKTYRVILAPELIIKLTEKVSTNGRMAENTMANEKMGLCMAEEFMYEKMAEDMKEST